jgi:nucleoid-associated protein YgaU
MRRFGLPLLVAADVATLVAAAPDAALPAHLTAPHAWIAASGADAVTADLAAVGLWLAALWTTVGLVSAAAARLPGSLGRAADRLARVVLPRAVYRLAAGATGMGVLLAPIAASAHGATTAHTPATVAAPAWPSDSPLPAPAWPLGPSTEAAPPARHGRAPAAAATVVTVRPGDSLWTIAAAHLDGRATPRRIAAQWPRWFAVNRAVIGDDPNHLVPGQVLAAPQRAVRPAHRPAAEQARP